MTEAKPDVLAQAKEGPVTVEDLNALVAEEQKLKAEVEEITEKEITTRNKKIAAIKGRIVSYLKDLKMEDYKSPIANLKIEQKWRVNLPQEEAKLVFFDWLREQGLFEQMATVNSASLNSLYMKSWEAAKARGEGMTFSIPGIGAPQLFEDVSIKARKDVKKPAPPEEASQETRESPSRF